MTINLNPRKETRARAFLVGVGSLLDLNGLTTYRAMQRLHPDPELRPMAEIYRDINELMATTPTSITSLRSLSLK